MEVDQLLQQAVEKNASDLHLSSGMSPIVRVDGELEQLSDEQLSHEALSERLKAMLTEEQKTQLEDTLELDFSYEIPKLSRFRVNFFFQDRGISAVFRVIPAQVVALEDLELPPVLEKFCQLPRGLVLVTGPTGSGKSTTLAAMLDYVNAKRSAHILTLEDPIEYVHHSQKSLVQQREIAHHTKSFSNALRAALREDPDIILVGEMRDLETIRLALTAAETGHLVFGTLHTSSAAKTVNRIVDVFPGDEKALVRSMLAESLEAVVAQVLVKRVGSGRVAAHEIMSCTPAIRNLIREDKIHQIYSAIQTGKNMGMQTLEQGLNSLVQKNIIEQDTATSLLVN